MAYFIGHMFKSNIYLTHVHFEQALLSNTCSFRTSSSKELSTLSNRTAPCLPMEKQVATACLVVLYVTLFLLQALTVFASKDIK